ncbi:MAG: hypothetical protein E6G18_00980 [Actinobacteria bacterium]|nr:MAG: hypothetical protein E6G18_00980 [Actinomycetota bacterium]
MRLAQRLEKLELLLGPCPDCRQPTIELRYTDAPKAKAETTELCPSCGEPIKRIIVLLAFDPNLGRER